MSKIQNKIDSWCLVFFDEIILRKRKKHQNHSIVKISKKCSLKIGFDYNLYIKLRDKDAVYPSGLYYLTLNEYDEKHDKDDIEHHIDIIDSKVVFQFE